MQKLEIFRGGNMQSFSGYSKFQLKKPAVVRENLKVRSCSWNQSTGECFGSMCFWTTCGECPMYDKIKAAKKN